MNQPNRSEEIMENSSEEEIEKSPAMKPFNNILKPLHTDMFIIRQQPIKGKAIGFTQQFGNFIIPPNPKENYICHARLISAEDGSDCSVLRVGGEDLGEIYCTLKGHRDVIGNILTDPADGVPKLFFLFPDLSVRIAGRYQIVLYIQKMHDLNAPIFSTVTKPFRIYTSRRYPGREEPTPLTKSFCRIGAINLPRLGMGLGYRDPDKDILQDQEDTYDVKVTASVAVNPIHSSPSVQSVKKSDVSVHQRL